MPKRHEKPLPLLTLVEESKANNMPIPVLPTCELHPTLGEAIRIITAAGLQISKPKKLKMMRRRNPKDRVGPTFVAEFADGTITRMSTYVPSLENLDWGRGERLAQAAYQSRWRTRVLAQYREQNGGLHLTRWQYREPALNLVAPVPPAIISARFEQDGKVLGTRP